MSDTNNGLPEGLLGTAYYSKATGGLYTSPLPEKMRCVEVEILPVGSRERLRKLEAFALSVSSHYSGSLDHHPPYVSRARALSKEKK